MPRDELVEVGRGMAITPQPAFPLRHKLHDLLSEISSFAPDSQIGKLLPRDVSVWDISVFIVEPVAPLVTQAVIKSILSRKDALGLLTLRHASVVGGSKIPG